MSELEDFRSEVRSWLEEKSPKALRGQGLATMMSMEGGAQPAAEIAKAQRAWLEMMAERGWTAPTWPKEYTGGGLSQAQARVLQQETSRLRLPPPTMGMGLSMIGPTLLVHGNEEQKQRHLPKIVSGEVRWCQGFSEPNAGSDLASLQAAAVLDGDEYVINGQKTWTSGGQYANWIFMIVRTDQRSKHNGITFLLADMKTPGIEVRPIRLISGNSPFCETFFENVRVPKENVVGGENRGWTVAKTLLGFERSGMGGVGGGAPRRRPGQASESGMVTAAKAAFGEKDGRLADGHVRDKLAQLQLDQLALGLTVRRSAESRKLTGSPGPEMSMFKLYTSELGHRRDELNLTIRGIDALLWEGDRESDKVAQARAWLSAKATTIYGGTSEIQRNIITKRVLQLPTS